MYEVELKRTTEASATIEFGVVDHRCPYRYVGFTKTSRAHSVTRQRKLDNARPGFAACLRAAVTCEIDCFCYYRRT
jgi:hypothetical protein